MRILFLRDQNRKWSRRDRFRRRGVSPIIATILLVAITVVLAALLYLLIFNLTSTPGKQPYFVSFAKGMPSQGASPTFYYSFSLTTSAGLTTALFGLGVTTPGGAGIGIGPTSTCSGNFTSCAAPATPGAWYAVLTGTTGIILAVYSGTGWSASIGVPISASLVVVSNGPLAGTGDLLNTFGLSGATVTGSTNL